MEKPQKISFTKDETSEEYHANKEYIGSTSLKYFKKSPLHFKEKTELDTPAIRFGTMYHEFILEPDLFKENYYVFDDSEIISILIAEGSKNPRATNKYKDWAKAEMEEIGSREIVTVDEMKQMEDMKTKLFSHFYIRYLLTNDKGISELSHYTELEGVKVKVKPDRMIKHKRLIIDLKTCNDASIDKFERHSADLGYHISGAMYCDAVENIYKTNGIWSFIIIAQEKTPPYAFNMFKLSPQALAVGQYEYETLLKQYDYCLKNNIYRGYDVFCDNKYGMNELNVPAYMIKELNFYNEYK